MTDGKDKSWYQKKIMYRNAQQIIPRNEIDENKAILYPCFLNPVSNLLFTDAYEMIINELLLDKSENQNYVFELTITKTKEFAND